MRDYGNRYRIKLTIHDRWGQWHEGNVYDVRQTLSESDIDTYPNNFTCKVQIRHRENRKQWTRRGHGKYIGNFSPVWVNFNGKSVQLTELLRQTDE